MKTARSAWLGLLLLVPSLAAGRRPGRATRRRSARPSTPSPGPSARATPRRSPACSPRTARPSTPRATRSRGARPSRATTPPGSPRPRATSSSRASSRSSRSPPASRPSTAGARRPRQRRLRGRRRPLRGDLRQARRRWLVASIRELPDKDLSHHERLKELEWLVGDWVEETEDAVVATSVRLVRRQEIPAPHVRRPGQGQARPERHAADRLGPAHPADQVVGLRLQRRLRRGPLDPQRRPVGHQVHRRPARRPDDHGDPGPDLRRQGPHALEVDRPDPRRRDRRRTSTRSSWSASRPQPKK